MDRPDEFDLRLSELHDHLLGDESFDESLERITHLAVDLLGPCDTGGISMPKGTNYETRVYTDDRTLEVDTIQYATDEGPCLDALRLNEVVLVEDMAGDDRWPRYRPGAVAHGVVSSVSAPLRVHGQAVGALNLYSLTEHLTTDVADTALRFGEQAGVALTNAQTYQRTLALIDNLHIALESRDLIGQAKGILVVQRGLSPDEAFEELRHESQRNNTKVRDVASAIVESATRAATADRSDI